MKRLAIITTHPIQYNAPLFKLLTERGNIHLKVFYTWSQSKDGLLFDPGFGISRQWDIPVLEGYEYEFIDNQSKDPGSHHFWGIRNDELIKKIKSFSPDAILVYGWAFYSHLKTICSFGKKTRVLFRGDSTLLDNDKVLWIKRGIKKIFLSIIFSRIDKALYVGRANKAYFEYYGLKERKLLFAPHAIDNDRFSFNSETYEQAAKEWRKKLGIPDENVVFLYAGKLESKKAPDLLIKAFLSLGEENIDMVICGNGELEDNLKQLASGYSNIHFMPFQNQQQMPVVYRIGDVFVLPSRGPGETWGLAVNEAMACGRPVIVSNRCGCAQDLVEHNVSGYIFEADSLLSLIHCMKNILESDSMLQMRETNSIKIKEFSYDAVCNSIEKTISTD
jgi:glycosyltransferase involved in cell wall biosynthesis